jgi:glycosyltransferase involved in cell wall biosynthesis
MSNAVVSIIMPARNGEAYIASALRSLLRESNVGLDIIVVDDGSTDRTVEIVRGVAAENPCVRIVDGPQSGVSAARNAGLAAVPKDVPYISFLDCDDLNVPGRIARQLGKLRERPDAGYAIGLIQFFEEADEVNVVPLSGSRTMTVKGVQLAAALFDRKVFEQVGGFDEEMNHGEDTDFFLRLLEAQIPYVSEDEAAVLYRRHTGNMTNDVEKTRRGFVDAIRRSLVRRRASGAAAELGDLFRSRGNAEDTFRIG